MLSRSTSVTIFFNSDHVRLVAERTHHHKQILRVDAGLAAGRVLVVLLEEVEAVLNLVELVALSSFFRRKNLPVATPSPCRLESARKKYGEREDEKGVITGGNGVPPFSFWCSWVGWRRSGSAQAFLSSNGEPAARTHVSVSWPRARSLALAHTPITLNTTVRLFFLF